MSFTDLVFSNRLSYLTKEKKNNHNRKTEIGESSKSTKVRLTAFRHMLTMTEITKGK